MSKMTTFSTLLRGFMVLSVLVLAAFTTNGAWAATPTAGDISGKKPATNPQSDPSMQDCLANGVHSALYLSCVANGTIQSNGNAQSKVPNLTSKSTTLTQNTNKNNSGLSFNRNNTTNLNQPLIKLGKVPSFNVKVTPTPLPSNNKNSTLVTNANNSTQLTVKNGSNLSSTTKNLSKSTSSTTSDPPSGSLSSSQNSLVQAFEKLTGHNLSSAQTQKLLSEAGSSNTGNGSQFIHQLEHVTGQNITNQQVAALEKQGSATTTTTTTTKTTTTTTKSDPPSLTQQLESITGHNISTSELDRLIVESISSHLNGEGETKLLQTLENITGHEISASEAQQVEDALGGNVDQSIGENNNGEGSQNSEGESSLLQQIEDITGQELSTSQLDKLINDSESDFVNSEGETRLLQEIENITGHEISASEAQQVEDALGGNVDQSIGENNNGEGSQNSEGESSLLQQIEDITGREISNSQLNALIADSESDFVNSEGETPLLQELENITGNEISSSEAQEVENALGGNVAQFIEPEENETTTTVTEPLVIAPIIPATGEIVTNVFGVVSSLNDANGVSNFVIGNTTVQLSDSLKGSNTFNNGDFVSVNGGFSSSNVFVGNALVSWVKPPFVVIAGNVSSLGIVNSVNETTVPGVVSFMIGNTTIRMSNSIEGSDNIQNGDAVKLEGFYVNAQNQVVSNNSLDFITASIDSWTPAQ